jgi:hypothetical protein
MAEANEKSNTPAPAPNVAAPAEGPTTRLGTAVIQVGSSLHAKTRFFHNVDLDAPVPSAEEFLKDRVRRMEPRPDEITQAAQQLEPEMHQASMRRQCAEEWVWGTIKNKLLKWGLWPRRRPPRRPR